MIAPDDIIQTAISTGQMSFDVEHDPSTGCHKPGFKLDGCSFATGDLVEYYTDHADYSKICRAIFPRKDVECVAYNAKFDCMCLIAVKAIGQYGYPENLIDPMIAENLINDNLRPNELGLKARVKARWGRERITFEQAWKFGPRSKVFYDYTTADAIDELALWKEQKPVIVAEGLLPILTKILMPVSKVFADMELYGIGWDIQHAKFLLRGFQVLRKQMLDEVYASIGQLNLDSGDQLAKRLFDELGYSTKGLEMTDSGKRYSVDADAMDILAERYPICKKIRTYRTATKMINTYVEPLTRYCLDDPNGRVHPTIWVVSATGRTRMEKPNFQNIPAWLTNTPEFAHLNIRKSVIAAPGKKLIVADFSQIELRLVAHISQDPLFLRAYLNYKCTACGAAGQSAQILHACPKCGIAENDNVLKSCPKCKRLHIKADKKTHECPVCAAGLVDPSEQDKLYQEHMVRGFWHGEDIHQQTTDNIAALEGDRQNGKTTNFALVYCATAKKMHFEYPELSLRQWQAVIDQYFVTYEGVKAWHIRCEHGLWESGVMTDIFGRKRRILKSDIARNPKNALNMYVNFGPQASACGMGELAYSKFRQECIEAGTWMTEVWPTNFVHDELVPEAITEKAEYYAGRLQWHMENVVQLRVANRAEVKILDRWGESHG